MILRFRDLLDLLNDIAVSAVEICTLLYFYFVYRWGWSLWVAHIFNDELNGKLVKLPLISCPKYLVGSFIIFVGRMLLLYADVCWSTWARIWSRDGYRNLSKSNSPGAYFYVSAIEDRLDGDLLSFSCDRLNLDYWKLSLSNCFNGSSNSLDAAWWLNMVIVLLRGRCNCFGNVAWTPSSPWFYFMNVPYDVFDNPWSWSSWSQFHSYSWKFCVWYWFCWVRILFCRYWLPWKLL